MPAILLQAPPPIFLDDAGPLFNNDLFLFVGCPGNKIPDTNNPDQCICPDNQFQDSNIVDMCTCMNGEAPELTRNCGNVNQMHH